MPAPQLLKFIALLDTTLAEGSLEKLTLGKPCGEDETLKKLMVRPVQLKTGPHYSFVYRHATRDITKNHTPARAIEEITSALGRDFLDAHLFTPTQHAQLETKPDGTARLKITNTEPKEKSPTTKTPAVKSHDKERHYVIPADAPWLRMLGITNDHGYPRENKADKFRQIQKFAELITHLAAETELPTERLLQIADMGCGKGYLTFAVAALFGESAQVHGIERRADLVDLNNRHAIECGFPNLKFSVGDISDQPVADLDVLIALHACDTATDDALAAGIAAEAPLLIVSPCCQKELRKQLTAPPVLHDALQHGIFQERQAEFVTDAMRAQLLEWSGYRTKVFEFISTEHTAKNLMIAAVKERPAGDPKIATRIREFATFYGITQHHLAQRLSFDLNSTQS
ncbi:MAG: methyltransferase [Opitutaceae bacterium]|nr:methyltransferase [Opitutaceae bacterium]|tara:strand:- start:585 stop:1784 length:1200 start_codon:yes stop_codon:yes gene_type:complete